MNRIALCFLMCIFLGCSYTPAKRTYIDIISDDYFAADRMSPEFLNKVKKECPSMIKDIESLNKQLVREEASGNEKAAEKTLEKIKWLKGWIRTAGCEYEEPVVPEPVTEQKKTITHESVPSEVRTDKNTEQPAERRGSSSSVIPLTFDECFKKCKDLTSRTNEECFDTCVGR